MAAHIDQRTCQKCPQAGEPPCVRICPGDLITRNKSSVVSIRRPEDCWDCAACAKACPRNAIFLELPPALGSKGSKLRARARRHQTEWTLTGADGTVTYYVTKA